MRQALHSISPTPPSQNKNSFEYLFIIGRSAVFESFFQFWWVCFFKIQSVLLSSRAHKYFIISSKCFSSSHLSYLVLLFFILSPSSSRKQFFLSFISPLYDPLYLRASSFMPTLTLQHSFKLETCFLNNPLSAVKHVLRNPGNSLRTQVWKPPSWWTGN